MIYAGIIYGQIISTSRFSPAGEAGGKGELLLS
jgi:hypothetical protein